jgi:hypothetical protein
LDNGNAQVDETSDVYDKSGSNLSAWWLSKIPVFEKNARHFRKYKGQAKRGRRMRTGVEKEGGG